MCQSQWSRGGRPPLKAIPAESRIECVFLCRAVNTLSKVLLHLTHCGEYIVFDERLKCLFSARGIKSGILKHR